MKKTLLSLTAMLLCYGAVSAQEAANIDFEDVDLSGATFYNGADEAGLISTATDYSFINYYDSRYGSWCGFAVSATTGTNFTDYSDDTQYNSCVGGGMGSKQFAVGYYSEFNAMLEEQYPDIYATKNIKPSYVYITNTANAVQSMTNGDTYAKKFDETDWLKLIITGYTEDEEEIAHIDFYLAKDGKIVNEWTKVDLSALGVVNFIRFTMDSSDKSAYGMNTPAYFCLDNMKAEVTDETPSTTGIKETKTIKANKTTKAFQDGKLIIICNGKKYNLVGTEL